MSVQSQRRIRNAFAITGMKLRSSFLLVGSLALIQTCTTIYFSLFIYRSFSAVAVEDLADPFSFAILQSKITSAIAVSCITQATAAIVTLAFFFIIDHRIYGPMVPICRYVDRLCDGDVSTRLQIRKNDEFKELVEKLNRLAEKLERNNET